MPAPIELLTDEDRAVITRWLWTLGMDLEELDAVPPLRLLVDVLAVTEMAGTLSPPMTRAEAWSEAAAMLGIRCPLRTWYRWQRNAVEMDAG